MENLNAEQIVKDLDCWTKNFDGKVTDFKTLCESLLLIKELTKENERLKDKLERTDRALIVMDKAHKKLFTESFKIEADAVRKYKSAVIEYYSKPKYQPTKEHPIKHTQIDMLFAVLDQIAKEMLEVSNE